MAAVDDHPIVLDGFAGWVTAAESGIRVIATAATADSLLAGPGRHAHVVLLDLDLGDGTTVERNIAAIAAAGPLCSSSPPLTSRFPYWQRCAPGALGYVLKNEETAQVRAAIKAVAVGRDWISPRLAYIFATDSAPDRPALSAQETRALQPLRDRHADEIRRQKDEHQRGDGQAVCGKGQGEVRPRRAGCANEIGPVLSSRRGRAPPSSSLATDPPLRLGSWEIPALDH